MFTKGIKALVIALGMVTVSAVAVTPSNTTLILFDPKLLNSDTFASSQFGELYTKLTNELHYQVELKPYSALSSKNTDERFEVDLANHRYTNLVLLPTALKRLPKLNSQRLLEFVNNADFLMAQQANVFVVGSASHVNEDIRGFLNELGIHPSPKNYKHVDHFNTVDVEDTAEHNLLRLPLVMGDTLLANEPMVGPLETLLYEGPTALLSNSPLLIPVIRGLRTGYTSDTRNNDMAGDAPNSKEVWALGSQAYMVVGFQGKHNNNRVVWLGSEALVSNEILVAESDNNRLVRDMVRWCFQETGVLRLGDAAVTKTAAESASSKPLDLKISDEVTYLALISAWNPETSTWGPYNTPDVQLEVIMLDPYYRLFLTNQEEGSLGTTYSRTFQLPDHHGIFKFLVEYKKAGWTFLHDEIVRPIRHLANDEFPRSWELTNAWVYISGAVTVVVAWFIFVVLMLYSADVEGEATGSEAESKKNL